MLNKIQLFEVFQKQWFGWQAIQIATRTVICVFVISTGMTTSGAGTTIGSTTTSMTTILLFCLATVFISPFIFLGSFLLIDHTTHLTFYLFHLIFQISLYIFYYLMFLFPMIIKNILRVSNFCIALRT